MTVTITNLGSSGPTGVAINDNGQIAGDAMLTSGADDAFLWRDGTISDLGRLSGDSDSAANGINNQGQVVGVSSTVPMGGAGSYHAVIWQNGTPTALTSLQELSAAYAINNLGQVVGVHGLANGATEAFFWQNGTPTDLGWLPGVTSQSFTSVSAADDINDAGQIVGKSWTAQGDTHAVLWQNGTITDLGGLASSYNGRAKAINAKGQIVGDSSFSSDSYDTHAVLWQNGTITDLGTLSGDDISAATAIDNAGDIVGWAGLRAGSGVDHAVMWQNGKIVDLNSLLPADSGWVLSDATGINDLGQIVGAGTYNGVDAAFVLYLDGSTPVITSAAQSLIQSFQAGATAALADTAADIAAHLDGLQAVAVAGKLSITLTDSGSSTPRLVVTPAQLVADASAINAITTPHTLSVAGVSSAVATFTVQQDASGRGSGGIN
ncbi:hypothetical protein, partial [Telmatospirillum sp.]|uniref:hypothetical protein n=1 Tax=Telmatospirillum sp. TaxID=2079197 RepID=UPI002849C69E